jgi:hypothetical protein
MCSVSAPPVFARQYVRAPASGSNSAIESVLAQTTYAFEPLTAIECPPVTSGVSHTFDTASCASSCTSCCAFWGTTRIPPR